MLHVALDGLPSEYDSFSLAIRTRNDILFVEELDTLLNAEERAIKKRSGVVDVTSMAMVANYQSQGFGRGRRRNNSQRGRGEYGGRGNFAVGTGGYNASPKGGFNNSLSQPNQSGQSKPSGFQGQTQRPQVQICGKKMEF